MDLSSLPTMDLGNLLDCGHGLPQHCLCNKVHRQVLPTDLCHSKQQVFLDGGMAFSWLGDDTLWDHRYTMDSEPATTGPGQRRACPGQHALS
jgi:hypothetical protein